MVHFCIIYFAAGTSKLLGAMWWNGTAIYYTLANWEFAPLRYPAYLDFLRWLADNRWLWEIVMTGGTWSTLALEIGFPLLVWNQRLRPFCVAASIMLHVFIAVFMGLVAFSLLMATMVISFIPSERVQPVVDHVARWRVWQALSGGLASLFQARRLHRPEALGAAFGEAVAGAVGKTPEGPSPLETAEAGGSGSAESLPGPSSERETAITTEKSDPGRKKKKRF
jgi:hypothetical protein